MSVYRPRFSSNIDTILMSKQYCFRKAVNNFENRIVLIDFNIDLTKEDCLGFDKLEEF